ncbi:hypothetical protein [Jiella sonneratiae]|uniref:Uncharacterized protein n=1 Tax=Jiella sonneratiae TaxID=2816856 RepID=A0ABS3J795_9HYPH|nr:hypothetical protein [Jiella sonneratiae]MBO0905536.1 hypothetical protein [Jiella sonneratiae]
MNERYRTISEARRNAELLDRIPPAGDDPAFIKAADLALARLGMTGRPDLREPDPIKRRMLQKSRTIEPTPVEALAPSRLWHVRPLSADD